MRRLIFRRAHVPPENRPRRIGLALDGDRGMVRRGILCLGGVRARAENGRPQETGQQVWSWDASHWNGSPYRMPVLDAIEHPL